MNKLLFSEGGQPVYLDDLLSLQSGSTDAMEKLISSLGGDIEQDILFLRKPEMTYSGTKVSTTSGIVWAKGYGIMELPAVTDMDLGSTGKAYVQIVTNDQDLRTFEDGQIRACKQEVLARISATEAGVCYLYSSIDNLFTALVALIDKAEKTEYEAVNVQWRNGYSGTVEVKTIYGGYRYHIKASSLNSNWDVTGNILCSGAFHPGISCLFLSGGDVQARDTPHFLTIDASDGYIFINKLSGTLSSPDLTGIDVTFDLIGYE